MVHQALFGYDEGHALVAASTKLSRGVVRLLGPLTDLSGPTTVDGFERSFTGLPLPETTFFALFRTWPAPEMPRPGCVWSQVLLIDFADLPNLRDLGSLRRLFHKPGPSEDWAYDCALSVHAGKQAMGLGLSMRDHAIAVLRGLYEKGDNPVFQVAASSEELETLVFAVWSQQWPRLRRSFRFSTGSIQDRGRLGTEFDLQVVPVSFERRKHGPNQAVLPAKPPAELQKDDEHSGWLRAAVSDLLDPQSSHLRTFLAEYGADVERPRASFRPLARVFGAYSQAAPNKKLLHEVAAQFPEPQNAVRLKETVIQSVCDDDALGCVEFLLVGSQSSAFGGVSLDISSRVGTLWREQRDGLLSALDHEQAATGSSVRKSVLAGLADHIDAADIPEIWRRRPAVAESLARANPDLLNNEAAWLVEPEGQRELLGALTNMKGCSVQWAKVLSAALGANAGAVASEIVQRAGNNVWEGLRGWLTSATSLPSSDWRSALSPSAKEALRVEAQEPSILALCAWLSPSPAVRQVAAERNDVQALASQPLSDLPGPLQVPAAFFLTTVGLRGDGHASYRAIARGVFRVHEALASGDYAPEAWTLIAAELPEAKWWADWDRCKRLRRGVRRWLKRRPSFQEMLLSTAEDDVQRRLASRLV